MFNSDENNLNVMLANDDEDKVFIIEVYEPYRIDSKNLDSIVFNLLSNRLNCIQHKKEMQKVEKLLCITYYCTKMYMSTL